MKKFYLLMLIIAFMGGSCSTDSIDDNLTTSNAKISKKKIQICHYSKGEDSWKVIEVNEKAVDNHLSHGDVRLQDLDGDGFLPYNECGIILEKPGFDCDDTDPDVSSGALEICGNGIDDDCDGEIDETGDQQCVEVGAEYGGGIVAYIFKNGDPGYEKGQTHGIIAAKMDLDNDYGWGCTNIAIPEARNTGLKDGSVNTEAIMINCNQFKFAAKAVSNLNLNGYDDWVLPSINELMVLYNNKDLIGDFGTEVESYYWSSTEIEASSSYRVDFNDGSESAGFKSWQYKIRAIRYF